MAQIDLSRTKRIDKNRNVVHDKVSCTYTVFENAGNKYIQIDTYGRVERETPEKLSQSLQFDKESAKFLVDLLIREFNLNLM
ncbi:hypothetical protein [Acetoanaerobium noterae]|uniref:hypothetical protein n=1 Tax=Acetoanaerobium noterae TaxID=745369 RepID=UPI003242D869